MFKPANPQGERNPLTNIMKQPNKIPNMGLKMKPAENVKSEVNSTFGGLGDSWIAKHKATKTLINAINGAFLRGLCMLDGLSIQHHISFTPSNPKNPAMKILE
jgi:hypothetical protein